MGWYSTGWPLSTRRVVAQFNRVARQAHHSLHQPRAVARREEDHDVAPLRVAPLGEVAGRERHFQIVSQLVDEHAVAFEDGRLHRAGGHVAPIGQRGADREDDQPDDEPPTDFLAPPVARAGAESCSVHEAFDPATGGLFKRLRIQRADVGPVLNYAACRLPDWVSSS